MNACQELGCFSEVGLSWKVRGKGLTEAHRQGCCCACGKKEPPVTEGGLCERLLQHSKENSSGCSGKAERSSKTVVGAAVAAISAPAGAAKAADNGDKERQAPEDDLQGRLVAAGSTVAGL